ncbi:MAG TPA: hydantoinase/carbamoylase family amidase [Hyphomicrobiaceae bacterium]|nr:hydantoinase/carbamoylase family amidase [Hyphomicrobiaceae bacterium]
MQIDAQALKTSVLAERDEATRLFDELRAGSLDPVGPGVTRDTFGAGEEFAYHVIEAKARDLGLETRRDHGANMMMTLPGSDRRLPRVMTGSHLDSVPNGGNFDGAAGVIAGLVAVAAMKRLGLTPRRDVTVMAIRAEESVWFQVSYIGSRSAFGTLPDGALEARRIDTGRTLAEHMAGCGADVDAVRARKASLEPQGIRAWVEVHIEQAPQLIEAGRAVAVGTGVPGNFRYPAIRILGEHAHVGLPRRFRRDAVMAASDFALGLDTIWQREEAAGRPMAFTIGRFHTNPREHQLTKVAGEMAMSLDVRAYDKEHLANLERETLALVEAIEARRGVTFEMGPRATADVAPSDRDILAGLTGAARAQGIATMPLASPASHDTATFATAGVPAAMLFVRNANGSHNPHEAMEIDDFLEAATVLTRWLITEALE